MSGETNLITLLRSMQPLLDEQEYVFCTISDQAYLDSTIDPICIFKEKEGLTVIVDRQQAELAHLSYNSVFALITLSIHSSLEAIGFLATITNKLAEHGISVNPVSAYYHDHLFVPIAKAPEVLKLLQELSSN